MPSFINSSPKQPSIEKKKKPKTKNLPTHPSSQPPPTATLPAPSADADLPRKEDHTRPQTENADSAVRASQSRRAPNPGGTGAAAVVQRNRRRERRPRKTRLVHRGRHDQPMTTPIMTAAQIGTAQRRTSIAASANPSGRPNRTTTSP